MASWDPLVVAAEFKVVLAQWPKELKARTAAQSSRKSVAAAMLRWSLVEDTVVSEQLLLLSRLLECVTQQEEFIISAVHDFCTTASEVSAGLKKGASKSTVRSAEKADKVVQKAQAAVDKAKGDGTKEREQLGNALTAQMSTREALLKETEPIRKMENKFVSEHLQSVLDAYSNMLVSCSSALGVTVASAQPPLEPPAGHTEPTASPPAPAAAAALIGGRSAAHPAAGAPAATMVVASPPAISTPPPADVAPKPAPVSVLRSASAAHGSAVPRTAKAASEDEWVVADVRAALSIDDAAAFSIAIKQANYDPTTVERVMALAAGTSGKCVEYMVKSGVSAEASANGGVSPLFVAAQRGNATAVKALLEAGASVDAVDESGRSALCAATESDHDECVDLLINAHARVACTLAGKATNPLFAAAKNGNLALVAALLERDANPNESHGDAPLYWACKYGNADIVKVLVESGADVNVGNVEEGLTPLGICASQGVVDCARILIKHGANPTMLHRGQAPLVLASAAQNEAVVDVIEKGIENGNFGNEIVVDVSHEGPDAKDSLPLDDHGTACNHVWYSVDPTAIFSVGDNVHGQLGLGHKLTTASLTPNPTLSHIHVVRVAAGGNHSLMLDDNGKCYGVGYNSKGQLGLGDTKDAHEPVFVKKLRSVKIIDVACGNLHTAFVTAAGGVFTTGAGTSGQLGHGNLDNLTIPALVTDLAGKSVIDVDCGGYHTAAVTAGGSVFTWGDGEEGQLGLGHCRTVNRPMEVDFDEGCAGGMAVACGAMHTAVLMKNGDVYTCGLNKSGQLGIGPSGDEVTVPVLVEALANINVAQIAAGTAHTVLLTDAGECYSFGAGSRGQLGGGDVENALVPKKVWGLEGVRLTSISCGDFHTIGVTVGGAAVTWGYNSEGQLGHCDLISRSKPTIVQSLLNTDDLHIVNATAGNDHTIFVTDDGKTFSCGDNDRGQLGTGVVGTPASIPLAVTALSGPASVLVSTGNAHTVFSTAGKVFECGLQGVAPLQLHSLDSLVVVLVGAGGGHSVVVEESGRMFAFGLNSHGQLGLGDIEPRKDPVEVPWAEAKERIVSVDCGRLHTAFVSESNRLLAMGSNAEGQLASSDLTPRLSPVQIYDRAVFVACGLAHTAVVDTGSMLLTVGRGEQGQLGHAPTEQGMAPEENVYELTQVAGVQDVVLVDCGDTFTAVVTSGGELFMFGQGDKGAVGQYGDLVVPTRVHVPEGETVSVVSCGEDHTAFITDKGKLYTMGDGSKGALGHGNRKSTCEPKPISLPGVFVISVACGGGHTFVVGSSCRFQVSQNDAPRKLQPHVVLEGLPSHTSTEAIAGVVDTARCRRTPYTDTAVLQFSDMESATAFVASGVSATDEVRVGDMSIVCAAPPILIAPCVACDRAESDYWYEWKLSTGIDARQRTRKPLPFEREALIDEDGQHKYEGIYPSDTICTECALAEARENGFVDKNVCRDIALVEVDRIIQDYERVGVLFSDPAWSPSECVMWKGAEHHRIGNPGLITFPTDFRRISSFVVNPRLLVDGVHAGDVEQGEIGTCYLLGSLSVLATRDGLVEDILLKEDVDVGVYCVRYSYKGNWKSVIVDDWIACKMRKTGVAKPLYAWSKDRDELYVMVLEKSYAKFKGSYEAVDGGIDRYAMADLCGGVCEALDFSNPKIARDLYTGAFWETMLGYLHSGKLMSCSLSLENAGIEEKQASGLLAGHAYALTGALVVGNTRLVKVRNPHGTSGWKGAYSNLRDEVNGMAVPDDGEFFMAYTDMIREFNSVDVTTLRSQAANVSKSTGLLEVCQLDDVDILLEPVYHLHVPQDNTRVVIEMLQPAESPDAVDGHEITLLVCTWRKNVHYSPKSKFSKLTLFSDLRTATIVDRVYPTRDTKVSLELFLYPQDDEAFFVLPSSTGHSDVTVALKVYSADLGVKMEKVKTAGVHSESTSTPPSTTSSYDDSYSDEGTADTNGGTHLRRAKKTSVRRAKKTAVRRAKKTAVRRAKKTTVRRAKKTTVRRAKKTTVRRAKKTTVRRAKKTTVRRNAASSAGRANDENDIPEPAPPSKEDVHRMITEMVSANKRMQLAQEAKMNELLEMLAAAE